MRTINLWLKMGMAKVRFPYKTKKIKSLSWKLPDLGFGDMTSLDYPFFLLNVITLTRFFVETIRAINLWLKMGMPKVWFPYKTKKIKSPSWKLPDLGFGEMNSLDYPFFWLNVITLTPFFVETIRAINLWFKMGLRKVWFP